MRLFEQFFDVQVEENRQMDSNESGGEPENLGSDIAAAQGPTPQETCRTEQGKLGLADGYFIGGTEGTIMQGNTQIAELMRQVKSEVERVQSKLTAQSTPQSKMRLNEQSDDSQAKSGLAAEEQNGEI
eukprot:CAMPEP_0185599454 /NCGR_PEP_ID=MMETSP0434-20130131/82716_1 /TAXON_ID=626734 ORGANISM="Favella taraikaensis, Strain Fe Narragansett Bay" /NCGR_SAMPLE_ID=MMETSP0434 /ASSEMBLY_ACC=CAM_ASM_000379 /LENGTH=127 /DNA_ID=CAMNT_0028228863 /DNA_START=2389 /DNA_END=2772 /DNA_ORIENTATION=+